MGLFILHIKHVLVNGIVSKKCTKCSVVMPINQYQKENRTYDKLRASCSECLNKVNRKYYETYRTKKINSVKKYYKANRKDILKRGKLTYNPNRQRDYNKVYRTENKDRIRDNNKTYIRIKRKTDASFRVELFMRKQVYRCINNKTDTTSSYLGYAKNDLIKSLGRKPKLGESIDHKIPVSWFVKNTPVKIINDLRNLQIMDASENYKKNNTFACPVDIEYYQTAIEYIKQEKKQGLICLNLHTGETSTQRTISARMRSNRDRR